MLWQLELWRVEYFAIHSVSATCSHYKSLRCFSLRMWLTLCFLSSSIRFWFLPLAVPQWWQDCVDSGRGRVFPAGHKQAIQEEEPESQQSQFSHQSLYACPTRASGHRPPWGAALPRARLKHDATLPCKWNESFDTMHMFLHCTFI